MNPFPSSVSAVEAAASAILRPAVASRWPAYRLAEPRPNLSASRLLVSRFPGVERLPGVRDAEDDVCALERSLEGVGVEQVGADHLGAQGGEFS